MMNATHSYRWIILVCCAGAYAVSYLVRWSYTGLAPVISQDLGLGKEELGLIGGAFFYAYAAAQVPWGSLADRVGGRPVIVGGVLLSSLGVFLFSTSGTVLEAMVWRCVLGMAAASAFVPIASVVAHWFSARERGLANGLYYGVGGSVGQAGAFLFMPVLYVYVLQDSAFPLQGWSGAMVLIAGVLAMIGACCAVGLRSYPPPSVEGVSYERTDRGAVEAGASLGSPVRVSVACASMFVELIRDRTLWLFGALFAVNLVALRLVPAWLSLYAVDMFEHAWGYAPTDALVVGGVMGTIYTVGHLLGSPLLGAMADRIAAGGQPRVIVPAAGLGVAGLAAMVFVVSVPSPWLLGVCAGLLGIGLHGFTVVNAVVADGWGVERTGRVLGWINMIGQFVGASALTVSGYLGVAAASGDDPVTEYQGIWMLVVFCGILGGGLAAMAHRTSVVRTADDGAERGK